jgi:hypothetical protein
MTTTILIATIGLLGILALGFAVLLVSSDAT